MTWPQGGHEPATLESAAALVKRLTINCCRRPAQPGARRALHLRHDGWPRSSHLGQLGAHVLLVQLLHRMPVELELLGDISDRSTAAASADVKGKSLG
jgi:hypothetical protein